MVVLKLKGASGVTTAEIDEKHYLFVTGFNDTGFSVFSIADDGTLMNTTNVSDDGDSGDLKLKGASGVTTAEIDGKHYLFVTGNLANGFSVFRIADDGTLMNTDNVVDGGSLRIAGARGVTVSEVGGKHYLFVTGFDDNGFSVFSVADNGMVDNVTSVSGGDLELSALTGVTVSEIDGRHYLFVTGQGVPGGQSFFKQDVTGQRDSGFSMFRIADNGMLVNTNNVKDTGNRNDGDANTLKLDGAIEATTARVGEVTYLFVTGFNDNGFSVFSVADDGMVDNVTNVSGGALELDGAYGVITAKVGERQYLFVAGVNDNGVSVFEFGLR